MSSRKWRARRLAPPVYKKYLFFQEGVWGNLAFSERRGAPTSFYYPLQPGQALGQGFGVGEEVPDGGVGQAGALAMRSAW